MMHDIDTLHTPKRGGIELKIIHVSGKNPFTAEPSGTLSYIAGLLGSLSKRDVKVTLISTDVQKTDLDSNDLGHIPVKIKKVTSAIFLAILMLKAPFLRLPRDSIIHTHRPDFMLPFILFNRDNPKVCTLHGTDIGIQTRKNFATWRIYEALEMLSLPHIHKLIAVNQGTKDYFAGKIPGISHKIHLIPVGIDLGVFKPMDKEAMRRKYGLDQDEVIILFIGRFSVEKGLDMLLLAFSQLASEIPKARLILLGEGPQKSKLENMVLERKIPGVTFIKPLSHAKISEVLNCADVFALCSSFEGMPTVVLEALACGVPVVATDVGDVKKVVMDGKTGFIVKDREPEAIKEALAVVIGNGRKTYSNKCVDAAAAYSWDNVTERILNVYSELTGAENVVR